MKPTREEAAADLLDKTFDVLLTDGWCQHALEDPNGAHCVLGALEVADHGVCRTGLSQTGRVAFSAIREYAAERGYPGEVDWNNAEERTFDEILDGVQVCAKRLREQAGAA